ncbi:MAG: amidohydrolase [Pseudolysinimonas sp.]
MAPVVYFNARVFTASEPEWAEAFVVDSERIVYVGDELTARRVAGGDCLEVDLGGRTVLPGFVEAHAHILATGEAVGSVDLSGSRDLAEIQQRIADWAASHPASPRVKALGWNPAMVPGGRPTRQQLDAIVSDRPVYAQSFDFHSIWLNSAALSEVGIDRNSVAPSGGAISFDPETGEATGYVDETAVQALVFPVLDRVATEADRDAHLMAALRGYRETGVTASVDMSFGETDLVALVNAERAGTLTARIAAHWIVRHSEDLAENLAQVARAAELASLHNSPWFRVTGIKIVVDGTVDGCTAALGEPYANGEMPGPIWPLSDLAPVVAAADAAGLQVAMHAIGDEAVRIAIEAVEYAVLSNGPRPRRHRIEHLEVVTPAEISRLAALEIVASMQPVHADPAIQENWSSVLGDARVERGFPWPEMTAAGARLAFGTDSPTAPYPPLSNMFVAATRRSASDSSLAPNIERYAVPLADAIRHATHDSAWACKAEEQFGRVAAGLYADFIVLDRNIFETPVDELLDAKVVRTVVGGREVYAHEQI